MERVDRKTQNIPGIYGYIYGDEKYNSLHNFSGIERVGRV